METLPPTPVVSCAGDSTVGRYPLASLATTVANSLPAKTLLPEVKQRLGALRQACLDLPFQEVSEFATRRPRLPTSPRPSI